MKYLVTGANRGIGLEFVKQLVDRGHDVIATARQPAEAGELSEIAERTGQVDIVALDITDPEATCDLAGWLDDESIDVLINNAGRLSRGGKPGSFDFDQIQADFTTNAVGTLRVTEAVLPALKRGNARKIMNVSSKMGSIEDNGSGGSYAYRMSKAALNMATRSLANDLAPEEFVVLTVHPGWVQTDMGGQNAKIDTETSVTNLLDVLDDAGPQESGRFWEWNGNEVPW